MLKWLIIFGIFWLVWKFLPKHAGNMTGDILKFEWIRELQAKSNERKQKELTPEMIGARFTRRVVAVSVIVIAAILLLTSSWPMYISVTLSTITGVMFAVITFRITRHKRTVILPLYLTLCRIPGSRWDVTQPPTKFLRVPKTFDRPLKLRLPMDWHAGPMQLREIQQIVNSRVPGDWKMEVDPPRFLVTFTPIVTEVVDVGGEALGSIGISSSLLSKEQDTGDEVDEILEGSPW